MPATASDSPQLNETSIATLIYMARPDQSRDLRRAAMLELSSRFASAPGADNNSSQGAESNNIPSNIRAVLRLYNVAARIGQPGDMPLERGFLPVIGAASLPTAAPQTVEQTGASRVLSPVNLAGPIPLHTRLQVDTELLTGPTFYSWADSATGQLDSIETTSAEAFEKTFWHIGESEISLGLLDTEGRMVHQDFSISAIASEALANAPLASSPTAAVALLPHERQTFVWTPAPTAIHYQLQVYAPTTGELLIDTPPVFAPEVCNSTECVWPQHRGLTRVGQYIWRIGARNTEGIRWSEFQNIAVELPAPVALCPLNQDDTTGYSVAPWPLTSSADFPYPAHTAVTDPVFGYTIVRATDNAPGSGVVTRHLYSTIQPWNSDESLLLLYHNEPGLVEHRLYDGEHYSYIRSLPIVPSDLEDIFWSYHDPAIFYYFPKDSVNRGKLLSYNVANDQQTVVADFTSACASGTRPVPGNDVQMHALDNDLFAARCGSGSDQRMVSYRVSTDQFHVASLGDDTDWYPWIAPNPMAHGDGFYLNGQVLNEDLSPANTSLDLANFFEHSSTGMTSTGNNALFQVSFGSSPSGCAPGSNNGIGQMIMHNLESGECDGVITQAGGYPYPASSTHNSATAYKQPGWVVASSVGNRQQIDTHLEPGSNGSSPPPAPALLSEIYLANTDTNPANRTICRLAHHRSYARHAVSEGYNTYFGEPHAVLSPSGTRVMFASDWHDSGSVNAYVVDLR